MTDCCQQQGCIIEASKNKGEPIIEIIAAVTLGIDVVTQIVLVCMIAERNARTRVKARAKRIVRYHD